MIDPNETGLPGEHDLRGECVPTCPTCGLADDGQECTRPAERECGCRVAAGVAVFMCPLHLALDRCKYPATANDIIIRALFAVAGRVAANDTPAEAVANVRRRFGL